MSLSRLQGCTQFSDNVQVDEEVVVIGRRGGGGGVPNGRGWDWCWLFFKSMERVGIPEAML